MSYILDALQRADAERARGSVPGLHTPQLSGVASRARGGASRALWAGMAVVMLVGFGVALWRWMAPAGEPLAAAANAAAATSAAPAPLPPALPAPTQQAALAPAAMPMLAPAPKAGPATPALAASALPKASIIPAAATRVSEKVAPAPSAAPQPTEQGEDRRRQIPALNITGAVYSEVPAQRMLLVNGLVLKQGDSAAPDLILEEIGASASVFSYRGERFRVVH